MKEEKLQILEKFIVITSTSTLAANTTEDYFLDVVLPYITDWPGIQTSLKFIKIFLLYAGIKSVFHHTSSFLKRECLPKSLL